MGEGISYETSVLVKTLRSKDVYKRQTQLDLPRGVSGLKGVRAILEDIDDIAFCDFTGKDVVRHSLVAAIVSAYDQASRKA